MQNRNSKQYPRRRQSAQTTYGLVSLIAVLVLGFALYWWLRWDFYWVWLLVINVVTFVLFRHDKGQAQRPGATRVPEMILLALLLGGGALGGAGGMLMRPRHKTHKPIFWITLIAALALHSYLFYRWMLV